MQLHSIQIVRAAAVVAVLWAHAGSIFEDFPDAHIVLPAWSTFGQAGVDLFFVVSGFVISLVLSRNEAGSITFLMKRAIRIYPFYWIFTFGFVAISILADVNWGNGPSLGASLLGLPQPGFPVLGVGWSLEHELIFYGVAAVMLAAGHAAHLPYALAVLFGIGVLLHVLLPVTLHLSVWDWHIFSLYHLEFLAGIMIFKHKEKLVGAPWVALAVFGAAAFPIGTMLLTWLAGNSHLPTQPVGPIGLLRVAIYTVASSLLVSGTIAWEAQRQTAPNGPLHGLLLSIGDASYTLYLAHPIIFAVLSTAIGRIGLPSYMAFPAFAAISVVAITFAITFYKLVERPFLKIVGRKHKAKRSSVFDGPARP